MSEGLLFFGKIALREKLIIQEQLDEALNIQKDLLKVGYREEVGDIFTKLGYLTKEQVGKVLDLQQKDVDRQNQFYGNIALENNLLTLQQLTECLDLQRSEKTYAPLGHYVLKAGYLTSQEHQAILKRIEKIRSSGQNKEPESHQEIPQGEDQEKKNREYGKMALLNGYITSEQLDEFFQLKNSQRDFPQGLLSDYLIEKKLLSERDHYQILNLLDREKRATRAHRKKAPLDLAIPYMPAEKEICLANLQKEFLLEEKAHTPEETRKFRDRGTELNTNPRLIDLLPNYTLERKLGRGGMAVVFKALDKKNQRPVAIKVMISPSLRNGDTPLEEKEDKAITRFLQEAKILRELNHPNIIQILDGGCQEEFFYYVMEYISGKPLIEILENTPANYLRESWALEITREIARGLSDTWKHSIVHRDIKADNIMIGKDGEVKIFDFGIAKIFHPSESKGNLTSKNVILGTPFYMSPEQAQMKKDTVLDFRSDMYALGVVLYIMLAGEFPFYSPSPLAVIMMHISKKAPSVRKIQPAISQATSDLIDRMLEKKPEDRFPSYEDLIDRIEEILKRLNPWLNGSSTKF